MATSGITWNKSLTGLALHPSTPSKHLPTWPEIQGTKVGFDMTWVAINLLTWPHTQQCQLRFNSKAVTVVSPYEFIRHSQTILSSMVIQMNAKLTLSFTTKMNPTSVKSINWEGVTKVLPRNGQALNGGCNTRAAWFGKENQPEPTSLKA